MTKLSFAKETLCTLDADDLRFVAGARAEGMMPTGTRSHWTRGCLQGPTGFGDGADTVRG